MESAHEKTEMKNATEGLVEAKNTIITRGKYFRINANVIEPALVFILQPLVHGSALSL